MKKHILILCVGLVIILPTIILAQGWVVRYNGPGNDYDQARAIALDNSGNVYVTGASVGSGTDLDYATVKYDSSGVDQWVTRYNGPGNDDDIAWAIALDNSGNIYITGQSVGSGTYYDYATIKYLQVGVEEEVGSNKQETRLEIYQNPVRGSSIRLILTTQNARYVTIGLYNLLGQELKTFSLNNLSFGENRVKLSIDEIPAGVYFIRLEDFPGYQSEKVIIVR